MGKKKKEKNYCKYCAPICGEDEVSDVYPEELFSYEYQFLGRSDETSGFYIDCTVYRKVGVMEHGRMYICVGAYEEHRGTGHELMKAQVDINYCPMCGRKL